MFDLDSRCERSSRAASSSRDGLRRPVIRAERDCQTLISGLLGRRQHAGDGADDPLPLRLFEGQLP